MNKTKRVANRIFKIIIISLLLFAAFLGISAIYSAYKHSVKLHEEEVLLSVPIGEMVEVNGHKMHVIVKGNEDSEYTLVFMHGVSYFDASITMSPLYDLLAEDYRIAYVDRSGNGYSEVSGVDRDIDTILEETREAISKVGVTGPYILVPHLQSEIEAMYWADLYPEEVKGIVGLDIYGLDSYTTYEPGFMDKFSGKIMGFCCNGLGMHRNIDGTYTADEYNLFTDKQQVIMDALVSKGGYNKDRYNEDMESYYNAQKVLELGYPDVPMYIFMANPLIDPFYSKNKTMQESYADYKEYANEFNSNRTEYFKNFENVTLEEVSGMSNIYIYEPEKIAESMKIFIEGLK